MTNERRVLHAIEQIWPEWISNSQLQTGTGVKPYQQIFQLTQKLRRSGHIQAEQRGRKWFFRASGGHQQPVEAVGLNRQTGLSSSRKFSSFESHARTVLASYFGVPLPTGHLSNVPKKFDLVSADRTIVGDAKYFDMVRGKNTPPAKFSIIAEHVWLLEKTDARVRFLVFGNNRRVPTDWLKKHGHLVQSVSFLFLHENGALEVLSDLNGTFSTVGP